MTDKLTIKQGLVSGELAIEGRDNLFDGHFRCPSGETGRAEPRSIVGNHVVEGRVGVIQLILSVRSAVVVDVDEGSQAQVVAGNQRLVGAMQRSLVGCDSGWLLAAMCGWFHVGGRHLLQAQFARPLRLSCSCRNLLGGRGCVLKLLGLQNSQSLPRHHGELHDQCLLQRPALPRPVFGP